TRIPSTTTKSVDTRPRHAATRNGRTKAAPADKAKAGGSGKAKASDPAEKLRVLLHEPKSALTKLDMSDVINADTWNALSSASHARLVSLFPPTAFRGFQLSLDPTHPFRRWQDEQHVRTPPSSRPPSPSFPSRLQDLDLGCFKDGHFLSAMQTFQDHLYTGWMTDAHKEMVEFYKSGIENGTLHASWKDEAWEGDELDEEDVVAAAPAAARAQMPASKVRTGAPKELRLLDLVKRHIVQAGDVLVYRRHFVQAGITIEKDVLIEVVRPKSLVVLLPSGTTSSLPAHILAHGSDMNVDGESLRSAEITSPSHLESTILDLDGRVERGQRPNSNAWKSLVVWRWREDGFEAGEKRGGREKRNTLFYLRSCSYYDI
ncbi:hypothetical protein HETIRDRAFT_239662, partial [Heterobasidion irregulare TC 32-1]